MFTVFKNIGKKAKGKYKLSQIEKELNVLNALYERFKNIEETEENKDILSSQGNIIQENFYQLMKLVETYDIKKEFIEVYGDVFFLEPSFIKVESFQGSLYSEFELPEKIFSLCRLGKVGVLSTNKRINLIHEIKEKLKKELKTEYSSSKLFSFDIEKVQEILFEKFDTLYSIPEDYIKMFLFLIGLKKRELNGTIFGTKRDIHIKKIDVEFVKMFNFQKYNFTFMKEK
jgi:hypothetical protein